MSGFKAIPAEIKNETLRRAREGVAVSELASQYGISTKTIYGWLSAGANRGISQLESFKLRKENTELYRIIGLLTLENTRLKKKTSH